VKTSESITAIATALIAVQKNLRPAIRDSLNPHFKSKYADLAAVWDACRGPLAENGIAAVQSADGEPDGVSVTTMLIHTSGEWIVFGPLVIPLTNPTAQQVCAAITYARRYGLSAAIGISTEDDDDGNLASAIPKAASPARAKAGKPEADQEAVKEQGLSDAKQRFWTTLSKAVFIKKLDPTIKLDTELSQQARRKLIGDLLKTDAENVDPALMSAGEWDICSRELQARIDGKLPLEA
jgi:hypothetical protein